MDYKELSETTMFSGLMRRLENDKKTYEKCIEITEKRIEEKEREKNLLRSLGLLDDF